MSYHSAFRSLLVLTACLSCLANATLPFGVEPNAAVTVKHTDAVSFDPLAVLAILWNPRASVSTSRLYAQPCRDRFRWPHLMQIGAITVPVSVLVGHLTSNYRSVHPALEMFMASVDELSVKSTIGNAVNLFRTLPVSSCESGLIDSLSFRPSIYPGNDIVIVSLLAPGRGALDAQTATGSRPARELSQGLGRLVFRLVELLMSLIVAFGLVFCVLWADLWGIVLFGTYLLHWFASVAVSFCRLIEPDTWTTLGIRADESIVYAVYGRPSGGLIVFRGTQETMERWARTSWRFSDRPWSRLVHWSWIVTGLFAALASVACMVNMNGYTQLVFLGMLLYGSAAEILLTVVDRTFESGSNSVLGPYSALEVESGDKKYKSIIRASIGIAADYQLGSLSWISLGLLPDRDVFQALEAAVKFLHSVDATGNMPSEAHLNESLSIYDQRCSEVSQEDRDTRDGIRQEIQSVWRQRIVGPQAAVREPEHISVEIAEK
ncbi:hypothetical protein CONLIGDRAFT_467072 [Coniochaeta ligniaria NRRL 30616]|uniref:Uncharacterized protein n=1 Tax=Coniochaeta ligniaria NRRL 30616 TaxID=1408157 RepID=A0A1J7IFK1_9PEZI|nr:hypothetical protein CONLIGDRAFT_467072 [Coniochaeta ligniaria NRRL 30616]